MARKKITKNKLSKYMFIAGSILCFTGYIIWIFEIISKYAKVNNIVYTKYITVVNFGSSSLKIGALLLIIGYMLKYKKKKIVSK